MTKVELVVNMISLRNEIRIALFKLAHKEDESLEAYVYRDKLPSYIWAEHRQFAVLHEEYVALKQGIVALA